MPVFLRTLLLLFCCILPVQANNLFAPYQTALRFADNYYLPLIDGNLDEDLWMMAPGTQEFSARYAGQEAAPPAPTEALFALNNQYLFIGLRAWDWQAEAIQLRASGRRDQIQDDEDSFTIYLSNGEGLTQFFRISAAGMLSDGWYQRERNQHDSGPDFEFQAAARVDAEGWSAEMQIPLHQLPGAGKPWHLVVVRNHPREKHWRMHSVPLLYTAFCSLCPQYLASNAVFWPWEPALQVSAGGGQLPSMGISLQSAQGLRLQANFKPPAGYVDQAVQFTPQSPYANWRAEERPYFLDDAELLPAHSALAGGNLPVGAPVYTRSISEQTLGVRASARGEHLAGLWLLSMDNGGGQVLLPAAYATRLAPQPSSLASIAHARMQWRNVQIGALFSERDYYERGANRVLGSDLEWQFKGGGSLRAHWLQSHTSAHMGEQGELEKLGETHGAAQRIEYSFQNARWSGVLFSERVSPDFRADNGFFGQAGYHTQYGRISAGVGQWQNLGQLQAQLVMQHTQDWQGRPLRHGLRPALQLQGEDGASLHWEWASKELQRASEDGRLHQLSFTNLEWNLPAGERLTQASLRASYGDRIEAQNDRKRCGASLEWRLAWLPHKDWQVKLYWQQEWLHAGHSAPAQQHSSLQLQFAWQVSQSSRLQMHLSKGQRSGLLYERSLELSAQDANLHDMLAWQTRLAPYLQLFAGASRRHLDGQRDAWFKLQWKLDM
ncbi:hypothetical protein V8J88_15065 [Massilia sp. W12]|uniref:hypothetical protein n=1 Tax=Massilia sp. W12 TaxID=3126507 RepID=UPI0030D10F97